MKRFLLIFGLLGCAWAQTTTTITGTIKDLTGALVTSGKVVFTLTPNRDTTISGVARFTPASVVCLINGSGQIKAQDGVSVCTLTMNTALQPTGTYYTVGVWPNNVKTSQFTFYAVNSSYDWSTVVPTPTTSPAQNYVDIFSNQTIGGNKTWTGSQLFQTPLLVGSFNNFAYVDGVTYASVQQAISSFGGNPGTVIVPAGYAGAATSTTTLPDNVTVMDYSSKGRPRFYVNPTTAPAGIPCGYFVNNGAPAFSATNPAINNCVMYYGAAVTSAAQPTQWGSNMVLQAPNGVTGGVLTAYEGDTNPNATTAGAHGYFSVAGGQAQPTGTFDSFNCFTANNSYPIGAWKSCFTLQGLSGTAFFFASKDGALAITSAVTLSASPQTVATTGQCSAVPMSQLYVGSIISVDTGGSQEDVAITGASCVSGVENITAIFAKNHGGGASIWEYGATRLWDAQNYVSQTTPYVWGSIQNYNSSHTPNVLSFGVNDPSGVLRTSEYFDGNGKHFWRDVGSGSLAGFGFLSQAGGQLFNLSDAGQISVQECQLGGAAGTTSPAACGASISGMIAVPTTTTTYTVNTTGVTANSLIFLQQMGDNSGLPSSPTCNTTAASPLQTARVAATSFTFTLTSIGGVTCFKYWIVN